MAVYIWEGRTRTGEIVKGNMDAPNEAAVMQKLRTQQVLVMNVKAQSKGFSFNLPFQIPFLKETVKEKDLVIFTRQFGTMIDAGLPLVQCLDILASQQPNKTFKKVLYEVKQTVEGGATLSDSLKRHPRVFNDLYVNLVAAGEVGGILDTILTRLSTYIEKAMKLKGQVKGAMVYPGVILTIATVVVAVLLIYVIPTFKKMFEGMGGQLPGPTQFVVDLSNFLRHYLLLIIIGIFGAMFALGSFYRTQRGKLLIDALLLKIPIVGDLIRKVAVARFSRTLSTLISSGVPILDGMDICARTSGNKIIENAIKEARTSISQGKTIAEPLKDTNVFPSMVVQMIAVGESTGALDAMLGKIADFYEEEVDTAVAALTSLMEPLLMVFLGVVVGGILIAMYLPIFSIAGTIK
ncbi:MAG TPA: type II secretion system F family protein [bacterium]